MMTVEIPCPKVLDDKEKKKRKDEEKVVAHAVDADIQTDKVVTKRRAGREGGCKKRKVRVGVPVQQDSEHVSSPTPLNHALPLESLANTEHVSPNVSADGDGIQENIVAFVNEGHGDNECWISGLQTQPGPLRPQVRETLEKPARDKAMPEAKA
ncbi:hypothetical protein Tco_1488989, partial [Tanacetum coccineum]